MARKIRFLQVQSTAFCRNEGGPNKLKVAFSSETPVLREGDGFDHPDGELYYEILDHDPANADISLLQNRGAFLDEHDPKAHLGAIDSAVIDADRMGRADITFGDDPLAALRYEQMSSGIRPHISFGYDQTRLLNQSTHADGRPVKRFAFRAHEISSVAVPADGNVGVGRAHPVVDSPEITNVETLARNLTPEQRVQMKRSLLLLDPAPATTSTGGGGGAATAAAAPAAPDEGRIRASSVGDERKRVKEIRTVADALTKDHPHAAEKIRTITNEAIEGDMSLSDYQIRAFKEVLGAKEQKPTTMESIGVSEKDRKDYSILRGIQSCLRRDSMIPDGLEGNLHTELVKRNTGINFKGFAVPSDAPVRCTPYRGRSKRSQRGYQRDLQVNVFGQGGATVATELITPIIEILRNRMVTQELGITSMAGLEGNVAIPRQTGAATAYSVSEIAGLTISTQALDQIALKPCKVGAFNQYSKQLLLQSSIDVENFIRDDLMKVIAIAWDFLIMYGNGAGSQPMGIVNTPGIGQVIFGGTATWAQVVSFETALNQANALQGRLGWATSPGTKGRWKAVAKTGVGVTSVVPIFLWDGDDEVNGYEAEATNQVLNNQVIFGNWEEVIHAMWGGYDVIVNPYSLDTSAEVRVTINTFGDVALRHAVSFAVSADAGNQ